MPLPYLRGGLREGEPSQLRADAPLTISHHLSLAAHRCMKTGFFSSMAPKCTPSVKMAVPSRTSAALAALGRVSYSAVRARHCRVAGTALLELIKWWSALSKRSKQLSPAEGTAH